VSDYFAKRNGVITATVGEVQKRLEGLDPELRIVAVHSGACRMFGPLGFYENYLDPEPGNGDARNLDDEQDERFSELVLVLDLE
jgi:hypothetical protein